MYLSMGNMKSYKKIYGSAQPYVHLCLTPFSLISLSYIFMYLLSPLVSMSAYKIMQIVNAKLP